MNTFQVSTSDNLLQNESINQWVHYKYDNGIEAWILNPVISFKGRDGIIRFKPGEWDAFILKSFKLDRTPWVQAFSRGIILAPVLGAKMSLVDGFGNDAVYWNTRDIDPVSEFADIPLTRRSTSFYYKNTVESAYIGSKDLSAYYANPSILNHYDGPKVNGFDCAELKLQLSRYGVR